MDKVEKFIENFRTKDNDFLEHKGSYWFSRMLFSRFIRDGAEIMCDTNVEHFGVKVHGIVYDITGDVTDKYSWKQWLDVRGTKRDNILHKQLFI